MCFFKFFDWVFCEALIGNINSVFITGRPFFNQVDSKRFCNGTVNLQWDSFDQGQSIGFFFQKTVFFEKITLIGFKMFYLAKDFLSSKVKTFYDITLQDFYNIKNF